MKKAVAIILYTIALMWVVNPGRLINFYKPHRWMPFISVNVPQSTEHAEFEICLEHGEVKRVR